MIVIVLSALLAASSPAESAAGQPALQCNIGPATKQFGGHDWILYGCEDGHSMVVTAGAPNPAAPFFFLVTPDGQGGIELHGEGTGAKSATKPAYDGLATMTSADLAALFQQARQAGGK